MEDFYYREEMGFTFTEWQRDWLVGHIHMEEVGIRKPHFYGSHIYPVTESTVLKRATFPILLRF